MRRQCAPAIRRICCDVQGTHRPPSSDSADRRTVLAADRTVLAAERIYARGFELALLLWRPASARRRSWGCKTTANQVPIRQHDLD
jgi:hypothetical protein